MSHQLGPHDRSGFCLWALGRRPLNRWSPWGRLVGECHALRRWSRHIDLKRAGTVLNLPSTWGGELQVSLHKSFPLLLQELAGNEAGAASFQMTRLSKERTRQRDTCDAKNNNSAASIADLPPVWVLLVEDLQDISAAEAKPRLLAGNQVVVSRVVIKVTLHIGLKQKHNMCAEVMELSKQSSKKK